MSIVRIIVAVDPNGVIGVEGNMPWHYKADFKRFKERTMAGVLIMGRKTFQSLPIPKTGPVLPGRDIIVVSRNPDDVDPQDRSRRLGFQTLPGDGAIICDTLQGAIVHATEPDVYADKPVWIAGGAEVYRQALELKAVDEIDLTLVPEVPAEKLTGNVVRFPMELLSDCVLTAEYHNTEDPQLVHRVYQCPS